MVDQRKTWNCDEMYISHDKQTTRFLYLVGNFLYINTNEEYNIGKHSSTVRFKKSATKAPPTFTEYFLVVERMKLN